jgi:hypothetical protein
MGGRAHATSEEFRLRFLEREISRRRCRGGRRKFFFILLVDRGKGNKRKLHKREWRVGKSKIKTALISEQV